MDAFEYGELAEKRAASGERSMEFFRSDSLSMGVFELPAGSTDEQQPHNEDEVYVVMSGRATVRVADEDRPVRTGSVIFVAKEIEHRFHDIEEDLSVLVLFAPPKT